ncbi:unnamed protein product, partial [Mesorhabditis spiculigera]
MGNELSYKQYVKEQNMADTAMVDHAALCVGRIYPKHKSMRMTNRFGELPTYEWSFDEQAIMDGISEAFSSKYGGSWTCLAGPNASFGIHPRPQNFIRFDIDETGFGDMMNSQKSFCRIIIFQN